MNPIKETHDGAGCESLKPMNHVEPRPKQETPATMVAEMMENIRGQFYGDAGAKRWKQEYAYIKKHVVLWPATWLDNKGVTLPVDVYQKEILDKLLEVKQHCAQEQFKYFPAYLQKCIKDHFRHNGDAIYERAKTFRTAVDGALDQLATVRPADPVATMAAAQRVLEVKRKHNQAERSAAKQQGDLFA
jgi:hypothetical protein